MKKAKRKADRDRLRELPNSLIHLIFSFLPFQYAVRTTVLSKRWRDFWITFPTLNFYDRGFTYDLDAFPDFVDRALVLRKGTPISKFNVSFDYDSYESGVTGWVYQSRRNTSTSIDLDLWLRIATENAVAELIVNLIDGGDPRNCFNRTKYWLPQRIYSCSSIRKLSLVACSLRINGNGGVNWDRLRFLSIEGVCLTGYAVDRVLRGAPQLEVLILRVFAGGEGLNIVSSSLKKVVVERYKRGGGGGDEDEDGSGGDDDDDDDEVVDAVMKICTPNVEKLEVLGVLYSKYVLKEMSCLRNAIFEFDLSLDYKNGRSSGFELVADALGQPAYPTRAENVTLSDCIEVMLEMKEKDMLASLASTNSLKLYATKIEKIVEILEIFPRLMNLVLQHEDMREDDRHDIFEIVRDNVEKGKFLEPKTDLPEPYLVHLRTVEITWFAYDDAIFPFIEFLLKYGIKLENMVIIWLGTNGGEFALAEEKVLSMSRFSPNANVIIQKKKVPLSQ